MANRKSGNVLRRGRMVRDTLWLFIAPVRTVVTAPSGAVVLTVLNAAALALRPFTIVRSRGRMSINSDQEASDESFGGSLGYCVVSDQASAIGVTAVPTPETDRGSDLWFVYETLDGRFQLGDASGFWNNSIVSKDFDSKAMRKVNNDQDFITVFETDALGLGMTVYASARVLIKLH